jgi:hypothetical protein
MLQRRTWVFLKGQRCYPNTYVLLIGEPGIGKGNAMKFLAQWLKDMNQDHFKMAPDGLTQRAFYGILEAAKTTPGGIDGEQHALTAFIEELGVFLKAGDTAFIYALCHIYDCPNRFHYKTASAGENFMTNAAFTLLSACTPRALRDLFTDDVMELGISARTIIIYADMSEIQEVPIFGKRDTHEKMEKDLRYDLDRIRDSIHGQYDFEDEAAEFLIDWKRSGMVPIPKDPRFNHYNSRRFVQIIKMCQILAASKRDESIILLEDIERAKGLLLEAETVMPGAIKSVGANPLLGQQQIIIQLVNKMWEKFKKPVPEHDIYRAVGRDIAPHQMYALLEYLNSAKWIEVRGEKPNRTYYPRGEAPKERSTKVVYRPLE